MAALKVYLMFIKCIACVSVHLMHAVPTEATRGHQTSGLELLSHLSSKTQEDFALSSGHVSDFGEEYFSSVWVTKEVAF